MASFVSTSSFIPMATLPCNIARRTSICQFHNSSFIKGSAPRLVHNLKISKISIPFSARVSKTAISCSIAQPETLKTVQATIAKQLSIDENSVTPSTKFSDMGADSLDTVEIMMALEEKFDVSIGESGAENISTVQDAADLIEKMKSSA